MDTVAIYGSRCHNGDIGGLGRFLRLLEERMSHVFIHSNLAGTLAGLGYEVELVDLAKAEIPVAIVALVVAIVYYIVRDKRLMKKYYESGNK